MIKKCLIYFMFCFGFFLFSNAQDCSDPNSILSGAASCSQLDIDDAICSGFGEPFCNSNISNGGSNAADPGIDYSCATGGGPNDPNQWPFPSWFYIQIDNPGVITIDIAQWADNNGNGIQDASDPILDVDFIAWGPFSDLSSIQCTSSLNNSNKVDCSWLGPNAAPVETINIPNAQTGEIYILMLTNFSQQIGVISLEQTNASVGGAGSTDCSIINVDGILGPDQNICELSSTTLDANPNSDPDFVDYTWEYDDGTGFVPIPSADGMSTITVSDAGQYQVTITDTAGDSASDIIEIIIDAVPIVNPVNPELICDNDNDGFFDFDFTLLDTTIIGSQTNVEVSYHNSLADAQANANPITGLYTNAAAYTSEIIYIRIQNTSNRDCASTDSFEINVFNSPVANPVDNQLICDDDNDGFFDFDLDALRSTVLGSQSAVEYTITFHPSLADADSNSNALAETYTNQGAYTQETISVRIENNANTDCYSTTNFIIDVADAPVAGVVPDQLVCDDNNDGFWDFDLVDLESFVLGTQTVAQYNITFHSTSADANAGSNILPSPYTNQVAYTQETIFARIENVDNTNCFVTSTFIIDVFDQPLPITLAYELCDDDTDGDDTNGFVAFDLTTADNEVLNGQDPAQFTVTYHINQIDADSGGSPLSSPYVNTIADNDQIIARVENIDNTDCYETVTVDLQVNTLPIITNMVSLLQCDSDTDGISDFNLTESEVLISNNSSTLTFTYHTSQTDAEVGINEITNTLAYTNTDPSSNPDTLFVRAENIDGCFRIAQLDLFVSTTSIPAGFTIPTYQECDDTRVDDNITDGITVFDFSDATAQIVSIFPPGQIITVTYYETTADALAEINAIPDISNHVNTASPFNQTITFRIDSDIDNSCLGIGEFQLETTNPTPNLNPTPIVLCDDITAGDLVETFDLTQSEPEIFSGNLNLSATYFNTYDGAVNATNAIPVPSAYTNTDPSEIIFVRVTDSNGCFAIVELSILVNPLPDDSAIISDFFECENNTDFFFDFDLESKTSEILNGQDPSQFVVTYHETQQDADNLSNPLASPYTNTSNIQTIFVAITNTTTGCSVSTLNFIIEVQEGADANDDFYEACDIVGDNDGSTQFDLASRNSIILGTQDANDFSVSYHSSFDDAENNEEPLPLLYENLTNPQTIYARVSNNLRPDECFEVSELVLQTNLLPIFDLEDEYTLCLTSNGESVIPVPPILDTELSPVDYTFEWRLNGSVLASETGPSLIPTQGGTYDVTVTDITTSTVTFCTSFDTAEVIESGIPDNFDLEVTSQAFTGNNMIVATATGDGIYEYSLNNGPWQLDNEFEEVSGGQNIVLARDINGCGIVTRAITIIDYPKFFTPNGDGNNDTWNIKGIDSQPTAGIFIYDRYGKLLKQLSPTGPGWDGTFKGSLMPSSDYWFTLEYVEPTNNQKRTFSAHFSLKR